MTDQTPAADVSPDDSVSRNTIVILVILTLLVSIIGTWTVLSQINGGETVQASPKSTNGEVSFTLTDGPAVEQSTGKVIFELNE